MFDLISIGDSVIDTYVPLLEDEVECLKSREESRICLNLGEKIPVGSSFSTVAGNAVNSVVGVTKLGLKTAIYTSVGCDLDGEKIKKKLKEERVNTGYVIESDFLLSNQSIVLTYNGERTILVHHQPWKYHLPDLDKTKWIYLTSLSSSFTQSNLVEQLINYLERTNAKLFYNPGTFQIKDGVKKSPRLLTLAEVMVVNLEEAKVILKYNEGDNVSLKKLLKGLMDLGPRRVVITDGKEGSYGFDGEKFYQMGIIPANLKDMTGAGDSFASGVLAGLFYGKELPEALRWGTANAASVIEEIGALNGQLSYEKMVAKLKEYPKIVAKEL